MQDYVLLMDVAGDVEHCYVENGQVKLIPMEFIINGEVYTHTDDDTGMSAQQFYQFVRDKVPMSTTQISPNSWQEAYEFYTKQGLSVLCLCLSTGLTTSFHSAVKVAEELMAKYPGVEVLPVDTLRATGITGIICERMIANKEKGLSIRENYDDLNEFKKRTRACAYVDDLDALKRGGRISRTVAFVGGLLGIKPLIQFMPDGTLGMWGKQRGYKASIAKMVEYYLQNADVNNPQLVYITHADQESYAVELAEKIKAVSPLATIKIRMLSPIIGVHLGAGAMVLAFVAPDQQ